MSVKSTKAAGSMLRGAAAERRQMRRLMVLMKELRSSRLGRDHDAQPCIRVSFCMPYGSLDHGPQRRIVLVFVISNSVVIGIVINAETWASPGV